MKFTCENCAGVCCVAPPMLNGINEIKFAKSLRVEVIATEYKDDKYMVAIAKKDGICPLLKGNNCSVHDNKFKACRNFNCEWLNIEKDLVVDKYIATFDFNSINQGIPKNEPYTISKSTAKKLDLNIVGRDEAIKKTVLADFKIIADFFLETLDINIKRLKERM